MWRNENKMSLYFHCVLVVTLGIQNAFYILLRRWSVGICRDRWSYSSVMLVAEVIKGVFSAGRLWWHGMFAPEDGAFLFKSAANRLFAILIRGRPMFMVSVLYLCVNLCGIAASSRLEPGTIALFMQMKLVATLVCSRVLFKKSYAARQWRAVLLVTVGVVLICVETQPRPLVRERLAVGPDVKGAFGAGDYAMHASGQEVRPKAASAAQTRSFLGLGREALPLKASSDFTSWLCGLCLASMDVLGSAIASLYMEKEVKREGYSAIAMHDARQGDSHLVDIYRLLPPVQIISVIVSGVCLSCLSASGASSLNTLRVYIHS